MRFFSPVFSHPFRFFLSGLPYPDISCSPFRFFLPGFSFPDLPSSPPLLSPLTKYIFIFINIYFPPSYSPKCAFIADNSDFNPSISSCNSSFSLSNVITFLSNSCVAEKFNANNLFLSNV